MRIVGNVVCQRHRLTCPLLELPQIRPVPVNHDLIEPGFESRGFAKPIETLPGVIEGVLNEVVPLLRVADQLPTKRLKARQLGLQQFIEAILLLVIASHLTFKTTISVDCYTVNAI